MTCWLPELSARTALLHQRVTYASLAVYKALAASFPYRLFFRKKNTCAFATLTLVGSALMVTR